MGTFENAHLTFSKPCSRTFAVQLYIYIYIYISYIYIHLYIVGIYIYIYHIYTHIYIWGLGFRVYIMRTFEKARLALLRLLGLLIVLLHHHPVVGFRL